MEAEAVREGGGTDNLKDKTYPNKLGLYIIGKGIYRRVRFILDVDKIF